MKAVAALAVFACVSTAPPAAVAGHHPAADLEILVDGVPAPQYAHRGRTYVLGARGARYTLRVWNRSPRRTEAVVSIDGRDVVDGLPADFRSKRGYLIEPWGHADIDGWRLSQSEVAAFRFASVRDSYAARTGSARDVGVIGVALFPERRRWVERQPLAEGRARKSAEAEASPSAPPPTSAGPPAPSAAPARGAGPADAVAERRESARERPGLGTEFGERVDSSVREVPFLREDAQTPARVMVVNYNDRAGLLAAGIDLDGRRALAEEQARRQAANPFPLSGNYATPPPGWRR